MRLPWAQGDHVLKEESIGSFRIERRPIVIPGASMNSHSYLYFSPRNIAIGVIVTQDESISSIASPVSFLPEI